MIGVQFNPCRQYRYTLERTWSMATEPRRCMFLMLNPSTADAVQDDPTIRRCINYAKAWGYDGLLVGNLYALRSTDPAALWRVDDPVGPENDKWLQLMASQAAMVVCAWGGNAKPERSAAVLKMLAAAGHDVRFLKLTKDGTPGHPLYLKSDLQPQAWAPA